MSITTHRHITAARTRTIKPKQLTPMVAIIAKSSIWKGIPFRWDASMYSQFGCRSIYDKSKVIRRFSANLCSFNLHFWVSLIHRFAVSSDWKCSTKQLELSPRTLHSSSSLEFSTVIIKTNKFPGISFLWISTNLSLNMISRCVDLKLTIMVHFRRLVADNVKVDGVVVNYRTFPSHQNGSVLLAGEICYRWRRRCCDVGSLNERCWGVSVMSCRDSNDDNFVFGERTWKDVNERFWHFCFSSILISLITYVTSWACNNEFQLHFAFHFRGRFWALQDESDWAMCNRFGRWDSDRLAFRARAMRFLWSMMSLHVQSRFGDVREL